MRALLVSALFAAAMTPAAFAQEQAPTVEEAPAVDPAALDALSRMSNYLRTLERFEIHATTSIDEVTDDGQKLQFDGTVSYQVRRPDAFFIESRTDRKVRQFIYNGRTLTVFAPRRGYYATVDAPATIGELARLASDRYDIDMPLSDLFIWGTPEADTASITGASHIGFARIGEHETDQYAFRQEGVDWQIWIQRGDQPLPRKIVITTRDGDANPEYSAVLEWNTTPTFQQTTFEFTPPPNAHAIRINGDDVGS